MGPPSPGRNLDLEKNLKHPRENYILGDMHVAHVGCVSDSQQCQGGLQIICACFCYLDEAWLIITNKHSELHPQRSASFNPDLITFPC
jgi:hypothetical protein